MADIMKIDIYELLDISLTSEEKEIKRAYRKKALTCHPDKNPDNPKAAELFQQLSKALEILTDDKARAAYDQLLKARKAAALRNRELDSKRRKLKEDLEARERAAQEVTISSIDAEKKLQREIERLRKEGSKQLEEEKELLKQKIQEELKKSIDIAYKVTENLPRLKVKWIVPKGDTSNAGYTSDVLRSVLEKYGEVTCLVISSKKQGTAIAEFSTVQAAKLAVELESKIENNPLKLTWICGEPKQENKVPSEDRKTKQTFFASSVPVTSTSLSSKDYESVVLTKLRQAEERKRLIQQMMEEDSANK